MSNFTTLYRMMSIQKTSTPLPCHILPTTSTTSVSVYQDLLLMYDSQKEILCKALCMISSILGSDKTLGWRRHGVAPPLHPPSPPPPHSSVYNVIIMNMPSRSFGHEVVKVQLLKETAFFLIYNYYFVVDFFPIPSEGVSSDCISRDVIYIYIYIYVYIGVTTLLMICPGANMYTHETNILIHHHTLVLIYTSVSSSMYHNIMFPWLPCRDVNINSNNYYYHYYTTTTTTTTTNGTSSTTTTPNYLYSCPKTPSLTSCHQGLSSLPSQLVLMSLHQGTSCVNSMPF